jgi:hypothetical protein
MSTVKRQFHPSLHKPNNLQLTSYDLFHMDTLIFSKFINILTIKLPHFRGKTNLHPRALCTFRLVMNNDINSLPS